MFISLGFPNGNIEKLMDFSTFKSHSLTCCINLNTTPEYPPLNLRVHCYSEAPFPGTFLHGQKKLALHGSTSRLHATGGTKWTNFGKAISVCNVGT